MQQQVNVITQKCWAAEEPSAYKTQGQHVPHMWHERRETGGDAGQTFYAYLYCPGAERNESPDA